MDAVESCTERIRREPYDPHLWVERGSYLLALNYPELAVGDAWKSRMLFHRDLKGIGEQDRSARLQMYDILGQALYDCHCHWEAASFWEEVAKEFPDSHACEKAIALRRLLGSKDKLATPLGGTWQERMDRLRDGCVTSVHYPWIQDRHLRRTQELVNDVNNELKQNTQQAPACYLGSSTLATRDDMLGMFASRYIQPGECILIDRTATGICSIVEPLSCSNCFSHIEGLPMRASCCSESYCSSACLGLSMNTYHKVLCGQDFSWLSQPAQGLQHNASSLRPLLMLRFLAACIQSSAGSHPLDHPLLARLQSLTRNNHVDVFTMKDSVITPLRILEQLGIDVFANLNFDTMVLHTIWTRLANNKAGSPDPAHGFIDEVTPFLSFFNHSCEPNVEFIRQTDSTTICFYAKRGLKKGEELFVSYLDVQDMSLNERTEMLWPWFEEMCLCPKCKREAMQRS
ncbi:uncharacterized protein M437DRAFT_44843 [Aureobasidium melanogenum CBS 110374]|uniref:SET domain-containing protein n=1 Tax=Aureobasidium melanogenum (strain CBS 110374) TaxID=1043003 RepID=A0A074VUH7_AURM1|nr:uncharacterized protein M437DRAFT_44843 [Aureobasidium melanogenum CBS 110374]KEQ64083.1 hypothetical protein M437DRAFT_44843 [Aureobasidium melanogenum CBS 110374]